MLNVNGHLYEPGAPELTLLNRSFKYGDGLFESIRVYKGHPLFLEDHLERLMGGMKALGYFFESDLWKSLIRRELSKALHANTLHNHGRIRLHVYRAGTGAYLPLDNTPYFLIEAYTLKTDYYASEVSYTLDDYTGMPLVHGDLSGFKTASALPYVMAARQAEELGVDDVVLFSNGWVSETSAANLFMVKKRQIITPPLKTGCLNGILRRQIFRLCEELKLPLKETTFKSKALQQAEEVFITNTIRGIIPVRQYKQQPYALGQATITPFLKRCFLQMVEEGVGE